MDNIFSDSMDDNTFSDTVDYNKNDNMCNDSKDNILLSTVSQNVLLNENIFSQWKYNTFLPMLSIHFFSFEFSLHNNFQK